MSGETRNEGEGSRSGARAYNKDTREFVEQGKVDRSAEDAKAAVESKEAESLKQAEEAGKQPSRERDPAVHRDYDKPT
jgi:protein-disulfide isomerase